QHRNFVLAPNVVEVFVRPTAPRFPLRDQIGKDHRLRRTPIPSFKVHRSDCRCALDEDFGRPATRRDGQHRRYYDIGPTPAARTAYRTPSMTISMGRLRLVGAILAEQDDDCARGPTAATSVSIGERSPPLRCRGPRVSLRAGCCRDPTWPLRRGGDSCGCGESGSKAEVDAE